MRPLYRLLRDETAVTEPGSAPASGTPPGPVTALPAPHSADFAAPPDWRGQIPEALRGEKLWDRYKSPDELFKSHLELNKAIGGMVRKPGPDAKPEDVAAFRASLGVPAKPTDYPVPAAPEGEALDQARWGRWTGHAHQLGLTPEQLTGLATAEATERREAQAALAAASHAARKQLEQEWTKPVYDRRITLTSRAMQDLAKEAGVPIGDLEAALDASGGGETHPALFRTLAVLGERFAEANYIDGTVAGSTDSTQLANQIREIRAQGLKHPANNPELAGHKEAHEALMSLYKQLDGTRPV